MKSWMAIAALLWAWSPVQAARIVGVEEKAEAQAAPVINHLRSRQLPKFAESLESEITRFEIDWETAAGDRPPLAIQLHYRTEARRDAPITVLTRPYDKIEAGRRQTSLSLPAGKRAAAWRVRILQGQRVLAERASATWE
jgi:hypothetical protein